MLVLSSKGRSHKKCWQKGRLILADNQWHDGEFSESRQRSKSADPAALRKKRDSEDPCWKFAMRGSLKNIVRKEKGKIRPMSVLCKGRAATDLTQNAWVSWGLERKKELITNPIYFDLGDNFVHAVWEQSKQESIFWSLLILYFSQRLMKSLDI